MIVKVRGDEESSWFIFENTEDIYLVENFSGFGGLSSDHITPEHQLDVYKEIIANQLNNSYIEFNKSKRRYGILFDTTAFLMNDNGETIEKIRSNSPSQSVNLKDQSSNITWHEGEGPSPNSEKGDSSIKDESDDKEDDNIPETLKYLRELRKEAENSEEEEDQQKLRERIKKVAGIEDEDEELDEDPVQYVLERSTSEKLEIFSRLLRGLGNLNEEDRKEINTDKLFLRFANSPVENFDGLSSWIYSSWVDLPPEVKGKITELFDDPGDIAEKAFTDDFDIDRHFSYNEFSESDESKTKRVEFEENA